MTGKVAEFDITFMMTPQHRAADDYAGAQDHDQPVQTRRIASAMIGKTGSATGTAQPQRRVRRHTPIPRPSRHPQLRVTDMTDNEVVALSRRDRSVERAPDIMRRPKIITRALPLNGEDTAAAVTAHRHVVIAPQPVRHRQGVLAMRA